MCEDAFPLRAESMPPAADTAGFYRLAWGSITLTCLCDGHFALDAHAILRSHASLDDLLQRAGLERLIPSHVNAFLIDDGRRRVLIDAGAGRFQDATLGKVTDQLASAGYDPSDIDDVLATHLHPDHIGGLMKNGEAVFSRATVHVARMEAAFWLEGPRHDQVDASVRATFEHARDALAPYVASGRFRPFDAGAHWHGYLAAESLPGHTHGHTGYRLHAGEKDLLFCGDLFHVASLQLAVPGVTVSYDSEPAQAQATRERFLAEACKRGDIVAAAHAPFPGLGQIQSDAGGYRWRPWR